MSFTRWRSLVDGAEIDVSVDIPDSAIAQYDAIEIDANDQDGITTWADQIGDNDVSGGTPTYISDGVNGNPSLAFDGDALDASVQFDPDLTLILVYELQTEPASNTFHWGGENTPFLQDDDGGEYNLNMGTEASTTPASAAPTGNPEIITARQANGDLLLRQNGNNILSAPEGSPSSITTFVVGDRETGATGIPITGDFAELIVYKDPSDSEIESEEQRLADKWGISL